MFVLEYWTTLAQRYRISVLVITVILAVLSLYYTINNLGMNTSTEDMLSPKLPWRQLDLQYERDFPKSYNNIIAVVEAGTPDQAKDAANALYRKLAAETGTFHSVYYPNALPIFTDSALLFLSVEELQDLADRLSQIQPFLSKLTDDQTLRGLFSMLSKVIDAMEDGDKIDIKPLLTQVNRAFHAVELDRPYRVSWQRLMSGKEAVKPVYREFIVLQPVLDYSDLFPAKTAIKKLHKLINDTGVDAIGAHVRLTGSVVLSYEEMMSVTRGTEIAMALSLCIVTLIMVLGLGSARLVIATLITLVTGLIFTATFATFAVGNLNLISVAFAVLYIGLGVDFAIHYCLRYREWIFSGINNSNAINSTALNVGSSLFLCATTTAIGFFAFIPTDYDGVAELGLISGAGMFISLVVTLTLLPALLTLMPINPKKRGIRHRLGISLPSHLLSFPRTHARSIKIISALLVVVMLAAITQIRFDYNTLNLQDPKNESVKVFKDLLTDSDTSPWTGIILAKGKDDAAKTTRRLESLPVVDKVISLKDFIPDHQDEKLAIIEELGFLLGGTFDSAGAKPVSVDEQFKVLDDFANKLERSQVTTGDPAFSALKGNIRTFLKNYGRKDAAARSGAIAKLSDDILATLPGRLATLKASLNADYITYDDLPEELVNRWHSSSDDYLLEIYPRENLNNNDALSRFVKQIRSVDHRLIGSPVINFEAGSAVVKAFEQAITYSFIIIALFLFLLLPRKHDVIYILIPLVMAAIITGGLSVILNIPLNFANVIAIPLLMGIGVDSSIHILHRFHTALPEHNDLLNTSSARAVIVSGLTTICSIGNLAFSAHRGTASMGELLSLSIAITLVCTLVVLPSLLGSQPEQTISEK